MKRIIFVIALLLFPILVLAASTEVDPSGPTFDFIQAATGKITTNLQTVGIKLFFALTLLQLVITGYGQISSGEIEASFGKFAKAFIWISFCVWMMTNNTAGIFVANTIQYFLDHAVGWAAGSTGTMTKFDANGIFKMGVVTVGDIVAALSNAAKWAATTAGQNAGVFGWFSGIAAMTGTGFVALIYGLVMTLAVIIIVLAVCSYVALKVFMVKIEAAIVLGILPLSLSFLGLNAMREQGFAPFKSMLALIYRIVILGAIVGAMASVAENLHQYAMNLNDPNNIAALGSTTDILEKFVSISFGFLMILFLTHKSDSIAASLANGSANLGSGDMVGAVMAAAAAGAAVATGGAAVAAGGSNVAKSMGEVIKGLTGGGSSISNAASAGAGKTPEPAPTKASASISDTAKGDTPPQRSDYSDSSPAPSHSSGSTPSDLNNGPSSPSNSANSANANSSSTEASSASNSSQSAQDLNIASENGQLPSSARDSAPVRPSSSGSNINTDDAPKRNSSDTSQPDTALNTGIGGAPQRGIADDAPKRSSSDSSLPGTALNAGIGGAPQRGMANEIDVKGAPKKPIPDGNGMKHLGDLGNHLAQEKTATHVSINTNPDD